MSLNILARCQLIASRSEAFASLILKTSDMWQHPRSIEPPTVRHARNLKAAPGNPNGHGSDPRLDQSSDDQSTRRSPPELRATAAGCEWLLQVHRRGPESERDHSENLDRPKRPV